LPGLKNETWDTPSFDLEALMGAQGVGYSAQRWPERLSPN
jgi:hypothetical protein